MTTKINNIYDSIIKQPNEYEEEEGYILLKNIMKELCTCEYTNRYHLFGKDNSFNIIPYDKPTNSKIQLISICEMNDRLMLKCMIETDTMEFTIKAELCNDELKIVYCSYDDNDEEYEFSDPLLSKYFLIFINHKFIHVKNSIIEKDLSPVPVFEYLSNMFNHKIMNDEKVLFKLFSN